MTHEQLSHHTHAELNAYTHFVLSLSFLISFVTDRTQADIDRVVYLNNRYIQGTITEQEKEEWRSGLKGALNSGDINRIESNIKMISDLLAIYAVTKEWDKNKIPRTSDFERIRSLVRKIWEYGRMPDTPDVPESPLNTWQKWNALEQILKDAFFIFQLNKRAFEYCGSGLYAGEGIGIL